MHEKPAMVVDETNRKIRETPIRSPQDEEIAGGGQYNANEPELWQRQVTSPLIAPDDVLADDKRRPSSEAADEYLHRIEAGQPVSGALRGEHHIDGSLTSTSSRSHGGRMEHDDNHKLPQSKVEHRPTPRNKPMIADVPVIAELIAGKLPGSISLNTSGVVTITGVIQYLNRKTGHITLDAGTTLELCYSPPAIQDLLTKDTITTRIRYRNHKA